MIFIFLVDWKSIKNFIRLYLTPKQVAFLDFKLARLQFIFIQ
jgi:hypothetical protein